MYVRVILFILLLWGSVAFALLKGGRSERAVALIQFTAAQMSHFALSPMSGRYNGIELGVFFIDISAFAAFFLVALLSRKYWPMWVAGMQGVALLSHLSSALPDVIPNAYANSVQLWSWPMQFMLVFATWLHIRDKRVARQTAGISAVA